MGAGNLSHYNIRYNRNNKSHRKSICVVRVRRNTPKSDTTNKELIITRLPNQTGRDYIIPRSVG